MIGKVICIPNCKGGYLDFWRFEKDTGQDLPLGGIRVNWYKGNQNQIDKILHSAKRDYNNMIDDARRIWKEKQIARENKTSLVRLWRDCEKELAMIQAGRVEGI